MVKKIWIIMFAGVLACLPGCRETGDMSGGGTSPDDVVAQTEAYVAFVMSETNADTKGDIHKEYDDEYSHYEWFNRGSAQERAIIDDEESNRVLFFTSDNAYYGCGKLEKVGTGKENIFLGRKPASLSETLPTQFLVVINGDPARLNALDEELKAAGTEALKTALNWLQELNPENPESEASYKDHFTMSSSIYRADESDVIAGVTTKEDFVFYDTPEEALLPVNLLRFWVERVLSKVTVRVQDGELTFGDGDVMILKASSPLKVRTEYSVDSGGEKDVMSSWGANIVSWGINGIEKNTYLFKTLVKDPASYPWSVDTDFYSYGQNTGVWNAPLLYRSFWAIDENYYDGIYPDQYRMVLDEEGVVAGSMNTIYDSTYSSDEGLVQTDYTLIYRSYDAFGTRADHKYSVENTYDESVLALMNDNEYNTRPWLRCGSHVIVTAQLLVDALDKDVDRSSADESGFLKGVSDKYFSNGLYWSEKALIQQAVATLVSNVYMNNKQAPIQDVLNGGNVEFINDDDNPLDSNEPVVTSDGVAISYENATEYFELVPAFIKGGDGWVMINLKKGVKLLAKHSDGTTKEISEAQLVSYIYRFANRAKHYNEGRMYYALPIRHNVDSKNFERGLEKVSTGDYGMVRNHWYRLTINQLLLPGTPVDDPDQPIIPNNEPDDKSLGVEVEIIPWHIVDIHVGNLQ